MTGRRLSTVGLIGLSLLGASVAVVGQELAPARPEALVLGCLVAVVSGRRARDRRLRGGIDRLSLSRSPSSLDPWRAAA